jgi:type IV secretory pathway protease TraF
MSRAVLPLALGLTGLAGLAAAGRAEPPRLLVNETASLPRGIYLRVSGPPAPGRIVALPAPAESQAYLDRLGATPRTRLLKRVAATGGTAVCASAGWLAWPQGAVRVLVRDRQGRPLPSWRGCRRLAPGELLLLGDTPASFDSRYFGPVPDTDIDAVYAEVLTW